MKMKMGCQTEGSGPSLTKTLSFWSLNAWEHKSNPSWWAELGLLSDHISEGLSDWSDYCGVPITEVLHYHCWVLTTVSDFPWAATEHSNPISEIDGSSEKFIPRSSLTE